MAIVCDRCARGLGSAYAGTERSYRWQDQDICAACLKKICFLCNRVVADADPSLIHASRQEMAEPARRVHQQCVEAAVYTAASMIGWVKPEAGY